MATFKIKAGDTGEPLVVKLRDALKRPESLDPLAGDRVRLRMRPVVRELAPALDAAMVVVANDPAVVQYDWNGLDNAVPGIYQAEVFVAYADGRTRTFPTDGWIDVEIIERATGDQPDTMDALSVSVVRN